MLSQQRQDLLADTAFQPLKRYVIESTGLSYYLDREELLADRFAQRLDEMDLADCQSYLQFLEADPQGHAELDRLIQSLTIGETYFFRHEEAFAALREKVIPDIVRRDQHNQRMRIWSAGSSIGAEAYSLSLLLRRDLPHLIHDWDISILGTDIDRDFLARAAKARYERWALRSLTPEVLESCFVRQGDCWRLRRKYREGVSFQYHNLVRHPFPSLSNNIFAFDVILCRNVLIYFDLETIRRVVGQLRQCLAPGGWLIVGHAEYNSQIFSEFEADYEHGLVLYRSPLESTGSSQLTPPASSVLEPPPRIDGQSIEWLTSVSTAPPANKPVVDGPTRKVSTLPAPEKAAAAPPILAPELVEVRRLADHGDFEDALQICDQWCTRSPLSPESHFSRALLLNQQGDHAAAQHALDKAIYLDRKHVMAHYYHGLVTQQRGLWKETRKSFSNVLTLLREMDPSAKLPDADGLSVAELLELTEMQLSTVKQS